MSFNQARDYFLIFARFIEQYRFRRLLPLRADPWPVA